MRPAELDPPEGEDAGAKFAKEVWMESVDGRGNTDRRPTLCAHAHGARTTIDSVIVLLARCNECSAGMIVCPRSPT